MSKEKKLEEAMRRSLSMLLPEARRQIEAMLTPTSIAFIGGGLAAWAASHLFGAGEIMDLVLLGLGAVTLGMGAITGGEELAKFTVTALNARNDRDFDIAARHFARAVNILGITAISAVFLRQSAKTVIARGRPRLRLDFRPSSVPPPGFKPTVTYTMQKMVDGKGRVVDGSCSIYGDIVIWLGNSIEKQHHVLLHELGHRMLTPKLAFLREFRGNANMTAYLRSAWVQYLEEVIAEAHAGFYEKGLGEALLSVKFPIKNGYVTISQLAEEFIALTNIVVGGLKYGVYMNDILYSISPEPASQGTELVCR